MGFDLFGVLDADWPHVAASRAAMEALSRWATDPVLAGLPDLDAVVARTAHGADPDSATVLLSSLVRRARDDNIAARAVLQALIPGLAGVARRVGGASDPDVAAEVVATAWASIKSYPWQRRQGSVAANLILDVLHVVWRARAEHSERAVAPEELARFVVDDAPAVSNGPTARDVLEAVARSGRVPSHQLDLMHEAILDRVPVATAARNAGVSVKAMTRRRERARASVVRAYTLERSA